MKEDVAVRRGEMNFLIFESWLLGVVLFGLITVLGPSVAPINDSILIGAGVALLMISLLPGLRIMARRTGRELGIARMVAGSLIGGIVATAVHAVLFLLDW